MLDLRLLQVLRTLDKRGSVSATAEALGYTPSAVSQAIRRLERQTSTALVARNGRGVKLTDIGKELVSRSHAIFAELEHTQAILNTHRSTTRTPIRLAAFPTVLQTLIPQVLQDPDFASSVVIVEREPEQALADLHNETADVAVIFDYDLVTAPNYDGLHHRLLRRDPVLLVGAATNAQDPVDLRSLADHHWLLPPEQTDCGRMVRRALEIAGYIPEPTMTSSDLAALALMAHAGAGVALIPTLALAPLAAHIDARTTHPQLHRHLRIAIRDGANHNPTISRLSDALIAAAGTGTVRHER